MAAALVVGFAGLIAVRDLGRAATFDEGVYLNSLRALQRGAPLGGGCSRLSLRATTCSCDWMRSCSRPLTGLRLGFLLLGLAGCVSVFLLGRLYSGVVGGAMAALLFIAAAPLGHLLSRTSADSAAVSLSLVGTALIAYDGREESVGAGSSFSWQSREASPSRPRS